MLEILTESITASIIVFIGAGLAFLANSLLQKKLLFIYGKDKAIDLLIEALEKVKKMSIKYWECTGNDNQKSEYIKAKYLEYNSLLDLLNKKYSLKKIQEIQLLSLAFFYDCTGGKFESKNKTHDQKRVKKIRSSSNKVKLKILYQKN